MTRTVFAFVPKGRFFAADIVPARGPRVEKPRALRVSHDATAPVRMVWRRRANGALEMSWAVAADNLEEVPLRRSANDGRTGFRPVADASVAAAC